MDYKTVLNSRGFTLYERCNCGGILKETYGCYLHKGIIIIIYPEKNWVTMQYHSIDIYNAALTTLEENINEQIVKAKSGA